MNRFRKVLTAVVWTVLLAGCSKDGALPVSGTKAPYPTDALRINSDTGAVHQRPAVAFNNAGIGIAVWVEQVEWNARMLYAVYNNSWSAESQLLASSGLRFAEPAITSDGTGFMLVYALDYAYAVRFDANGAPVDTHPFSNSNNPVIQKTPSIVSSGTGKYAAVWAQYDSSSYRVYATSCLNGVWSTPAAVSSITGGVSSWNPFGMASNGTNYAVTWQQQDSIGPNIYEYNIYVNISSGGTWAAAATALIETEGGAAYNPRIASNGTDFAVAWQQQDVSKIYHVYANIFSTNTWNGAVLVEDCSGHATGPDIASKGADFAVTWQQDDSGVYNIYANISSSGSWTTTAATLLESSGDNSYGPRIVSSSSDTAVIWQQWDAGAGRYKLSANVFSALTNTTKDNALPVENNAGSVGLMRIVPKGTGYAVVWQQNKSSAWNSIYANIYGSSWGQPAELVKGTYRNTSSQPALAINSQGNALAVWTQYELSVLHAYGRIYSSGAWGQIFRLSETGASSVDVATNGTDFMIVYSESGVLKARTCAVSGTLGAVSSLGGDPENFKYAGYVRIASNSVMGYGVTWVQTSGMGSIYASIYDGVTATWGEATLLESSAKSASYPAIASDGSGYAVAWEQIDDTGPAYSSIYANAYNGTAWSGAASLETGGENAYLPRIASNGDTYAVSWHKSDGMTYNIYANIFSALTASTKDTAMIVESGAGAAYNPAIASNGTGYAITWQQSDSAVFRSRIYVNVFSLLTDTTKDNAVCIDNAGTGTPSASTYPMIASDGQGYAVAWLQNNGSTERESVYANVFDGTGWAGPSILENGTGRAMSAFITSNGNTYSAIWVQQDSSDAFVYDVWAKLGF